MQENDPEGYKIYGLGQRGELRGQIYKNWKPIRPDGMPGEYPSIWVIDFGFSNDPTVVGEFKMHNRSIYGRERVYETGLDNMQIGIHLFYMGVTDKNIVIADSAEPKSIAELRRGWELDREYLRTAAFGLGYDLDDETLNKLRKQMATGYTVFGAVKGPDTIDQGISKVKQYEVFVTEDSVNAWQEYRKYRWAEDPKTGKLLNTPMDSWNHFMDTLRYFTTSEGRYY
jgi:phage terminase large subunit